MRDRGEWAPPRLLAARGVLQLEGNLPVLVQGRLGRPIRELGLPWAALFAGSVRMLGLQQQRPLCRQLLWPRAVRVLPLAHGQKMSNKP